MRLLIIMAMILAVSCGESDKLPDAVAILSPQYQEAYRLLPDDTDRINAEFEGFDLSEWEKLEPGGSYEPAPPELNLVSALPMLQSAAGAPQDREWVAAQLRVLDPVVADEFLAAPDVFAMTDVLRSVVEEAGFHKEVTTIVLRFGGMKAGHTEAFIEQTIRETQDLSEHLSIIGMLGDKERIVRQHEISVCILLMELVVKQDPWNVIGEGRCDIDRAIKLAASRLDGAM